MRRGSTTQQDAQLAECNVRRDKALEKATEDLMKEINVEAKVKIRERFLALRNEVRSCIAKIKEFNESKSDVQQNVPDKFIFELLEVFNRELLQQGRDMKMRDIYDRE